MEKFVLIIRGILLFLFVFVMAMLGIAGQSILRHDYEDFKESIRLYSIVSFILSLYATITYLCNKW